MGPAKIASAKRGHYFAAANNLADVITRRVDDYTVKSFTTSWRYYFREKVLTTAGRAR